MIDRDLLEKAAKAYGLDGWKWCKTFGCMKSPRKKTPYGYATSFWNPLTDDGDALRLSVKLRVRIEFTSATVYAIPPNDPCDWMLEHFEDDELAATRRAIVRAAASIGEKRT